MGRLRGLGSIRSAAVLTAFRYVSDYLAFLDARPKKPSSTQGRCEERGVHFQKGQEKSSIFGHDVPPLRATWLSRFLDRARATRAYLLLLAGGRVWQVAAEGGPPPMTARATCAYSLPTRRRASMPNSGRGRHADDDSVRYPRLHVA